MNSEGQAKSNAHNRVDTISKLHEQGCKPMHGMTDRIMDGLDLGFLYNSTNKYTDIAM